MPFSICPAPLRKNIFDFFITLYLLPLLKMCFSTGFPLKHQVKIEQLLNMIVNETKNKEAGYEDYIKAILVQLLIYIGRYTKNSEIRPFMHLNPMYEKISDIVQHINRNFMQKITLDDVSKQFYISRFYLSKTFKETTGFTFVEYLNSVRIKEAQKLLIITNKKIIQISYEVGFGSVAHFGRVFKTITGYSPLQYRKLNKTKK
jgi:YesN/AraC family two-component response regulator